VQVNTPEGKCNITYPMFIHFTPCVDISLVGFPGIMQKDFLKQRNLSPRLF